MTKSNDSGTRRASPVDRASSPALVHVSVQLEEHRASLLSYFRHRVQSRHDAEDYVQEVYLRVLAADPDQDKMRSLRGFLFRAASNLLIDKHRRRRVSMEAGHFPIDETILDDGTNDPERALIGRDALQALGTALETLSPIARDAFLLVRVEGLSHRDAAERLGIGTKAVSRHIERGLARLGAMLVDTTP